MTPRETPVMRLAVAGRGERRERLGPYPYRSNPRAPRPRRFHRSRQQLAVALLHMIRPQPTANRIAVLLIAALICPVPLCLTVLEGIAIALVSEL